MGHHAVVSCEHPSTVPATTEYSAREKTPSLMKSNVTMFSFVSHRARQPRPPLVPGGARHTHERSAVHSGPRGNPL
jgi:hypothetical protein